MFAAIVARLHVCKELSNGSGFSNIVMAIKSNPHGIFIKGAGSQRIYKYLNRRRVNRWHVPNGFAAPPAKITRGHIRTHVVDMNHVYLRIWHLTERQRVRARSNLGGSLIGVPLFNWTQQVRRAQGAAGVPGTLTAAEIAEIMGSNIAA
ncbi:hypothetical protein J7T55_007321 [Diaporthe amygdali]|uniref:uncharacterized protein n=1 Tax=Phomopsis amygdali TaxID=1214568 RepID=UPI0022FE045B|nr:uncharacterized protein J7T55_007321 [Diaporthe amygdali]KAJ0116342.1 hypothetical protein J7T55_007321 [Diaporthe amygdali]